MVYVDWSLIVDHEGIQRLCLQSDYRKVCNAVGRLVVVVNGYSRRFQCASCKASSWRSRRKPTQVNGTDRTIPQEECRKEWKEKIVLESSLAAHQGASHTFLLYTTHPALYDLAPEAEKVGTHGG